MKNDDVSIYRLSGCTQRTFRHDNTPNKPGKPDPLFILRMNTTAACEAGPLKDSVVSIKRSEVPLYLQAGEFY